MFSTILQEKITAKANAGGEAVKSFTYSDNIVQCTYCKDSGMLISDACNSDPRGSRAETGWFTKDTVPTEYCNVHVLVDYDKTAGGVSVGQCPAGSTSKVALVRNEERNFNTQVIITDAEFVYRDTDPSLGYPTYFGYPYFYMNIPEGTYVGRSSNTKQYNCACPTHLAKKK